MIGEFPGISVVAVKTTIYINNMELIFLIVIYNLNG